MSFVLFQFLNHLQEVWSWWKDTAQDESQRQEKQLRRTRCSRLCWDKSNNVACLLMLCKDACEKRLFLCVCLKYSSFFFFSCAICNSWWNACADCPLAFAAGRWAVENAALGFAGASLLPQSFHSVASVLVGEEKKKREKNPLLDYFTWLELYSLIRSLESFDCVINNFLC